MPAEAALTVAYIALGGVVLTAVVSLVIGVITNVVNSRGQRRSLRWQKEQYIADKKQSAYLEALKCLSESRILLTKTGNGELVIEDEHLNGRIWLLSNLRSHGLQWPQLIQPCLLRNKSGE